MGDSEYNYFMCMDCDQCGDQCEDCDCVNQCEMCVHAGTDTCETCDLNE